MELYFLATGVKHKLDFFETQMQTLRTLLPVTYPDGKKIYEQIYAAFEPIQLYRLVFPKEYLGKMLATLDFDYHTYPRFNLQALGMRKIMNAQPIPKITDKVEPYTINRENIALIPVGIKEDCDVVNSDGSTQEGI